MYGNVSELNYLHLSSPLLISPYPHLRFSRKLFSSMSVCLSVYLFLSHLFLPFFFFLSLHFSLSPSLSPPSFGPGLLFDHVLSSPRFPSSDGVDRVRGKLEWWPLRSRDSNGEWFGQDTWRYFTVRAALRTERAVFNASARSKENRCNNTIYHIQS